MPKKKGGKKKKGRKKKKMVGHETPGQVVKRLQKTYEKNCVTTETLMCPGIRAAMRDAVEGDKLLTKFVVDPVAVTCKEDPVVSIEPFVAALRQESYKFIKNLHIWDIPLQHENLASLALLLEKQVYPVQTLEIMDCLIEPAPLKRLALSFNVCSSLSTIILDYNEFGDEGCRGVCQGLQGNKTVTSLSMNYCDLGIPSGKMLGHIIANTAIRELYVDGNDLECEGAVEIIKMCVDRAEEEAFQREEEARIKAEEDAIVSQLEKDKKRASSAVTGESDDSKDKPGSAGKKGKKKKKGRKKKKKEPPPPPPVGPWISKLHIADNGIDAFGPGSQLAPLVCVRLFRRLMTNSKCLEELDLDDNLIGDLGGKEIMEALQDRKEADLGGMKVRTTHRMNTDTFNTIIKLGAGLKKKKKKRGKKKKKK